MRAAGLVEEVCLEKDLAVGDEMTFVGMYAEMSLAASR